MNTRNSILKKAIDLKPGDIIDFRILDIKYGIKYHVVDSLPSQRQSVPTQVVFLYHAWDPDETLPFGHEGRQRCSMITNVEKLVRVPIRL